MHEDNGLRPGAHLLVIEQLRIDVRQADFAIDRLHAVRKLKGRLWRVRKDAVNFVRGCDLVAESPKTGNRYLNFISRFKECWRLLTKTYTSWRACCEDVANLQSLAFREGLDKYWN